MCAFRAFLSARTHASIMNLALTRAFDRRKFDVKMRIQVSYVFKATCNEYVMRVYIPSALKELK